MYLICRSAVVGEVCHFHDKCIYTIKNLKSVPNNCFWNVIGIKKKTKMSQNHCLWKPMHYQEGSKMFQNNCFDMLYPVTKPKNKSAKIAVFDMLYTTKILKMSQNNCFDILWILGLLHRIKLEKPFADCVASGLNRWPWGAVPTSFWLILYAILHSKWNGVSIFARQYFELFIVKLKEYHFTIFKKT